MATVGGTGGGGGDNDDDRDDGLGGGRPSAHGKKDTLNLADEAEAGTSDDDDEIATLPDGVKLYRVTETGDEGTSRRKQVAYERRSTDRRLTGDNRCEACRRDKARCYVPAAGGKATRCRHCTNLSANSKCSASSSELVVGEGDATS